MNKIIMQCLAEKLEFANVGEVIIAGSGAMLFYEESPCPKLRNTDIDLIVKSTNIESYKELINSILDIEGVYPSTTYSSRLVCVEYRGVKVDIIPSKTEILGLKNNWFKYVFEVNPYIGLTCHVAVINSSLFVASKIEAAIDQVNDQLFHSKHKDDVLHILNNVPLVFDERSLQSRAIYEFIYIGLKSLEIDPLKYLQNFIEVEFV
jgi:hypothetical protein